MRTILLGRLLPAALILLLAACSIPTPENPPNTVAPAIAAPAETETAPATTVPETETPGPDAGDSLASVEYDLGEVTIVQSNFPEDSRFRNMPVRLNGLIATPDAATLEDGPAPVVVILHGAHPGCPVNEFGVDAWPCAPDVEQPNYRGFDYLVNYLAEQGYVALSININGDNTFGFGEGVGGERLAQILDAHLGALAIAAGGGENQFGVDLAGVADTGRIAMFGHSRGGEGALWYAHQQGLTSAEGAAEKGFGPVEGLLLIAPAVATHMPVASEVPLAVILPACDGDVISQDGQVFYEAARMNPEQAQPVTSVWLERANHNYFNETLGGDMMGNFGRPDCEPLLSPFTQRGFMLDYATDFLTTVFSEDETEAAVAAVRMGMVVPEHAPSALYGLPARVSSLSPAADRQTLFIPANADELTTNRAGGAVTTDGASISFCPEGFYSPATMPGTEPCRRVNVTVPGQPAHAVVSWEQPDSALKLALPEGSGDLSGFNAISLRAAVEPLSSLNQSGSPQAFSVRLTDGAGNSAIVTTRPGEPALVFPPGYVEENDFFEGGLFTGRVPMTTIRLLLSDFAGVDLSNIVELALVFDQTAAGSLFLGDIELVR